MRIIDKNTDFYDYWENIYKDNTFTFDRRDSFVLTKKDMCSFITPYLSRYWNWQDKTYKHSEFNYILLQICNTHWLFLIECNKFNNYGALEDYNIELLATWRNFNKPRTLCALDIIKFYGYYKYNTKELIYNNIDKFIDAVNRNDYKLKKRIDKLTVYIGDKKTEKHIPLLKACGLGSCMDAHETYLAFEEYFSLEKSASERREPIGTTDIDKIESHGFDKKISFRGK